MATVRSSPDAKGDTVPTSCVREEAGGGGGESRPRGAFRGRVY
ncbi:hypothetical protein [Myxococcus phage Mx1]|nr:hypothetical protein [Myxococcus phage Mx1]